MKTLEEHNKERAKQHRELNSNEPRLNGISCPECGEELYDTTPNMYLMSCPAQLNINCVSCNYTGFRIA